VLKTKVAFLDEVEEVHALWQWVTTSNGDDETKVGANETVLSGGCIAQVTAKRCTALTSLEALGCFATSFDGFGKLALVLGGEERNFADVIEIEAN
jgi:hypothetical protein